MNYSEYLERCTKVGFTKGIPSAEDFEAKSDVYLQVLLKEESHLTYEKIVSGIDVDSPRCGVCGSAKVKVYGNACRWCIERGQAPK